jgi:hypothetical protein
MGLLQTGRTKTIVSKEHHLNQLFEHMLLTGPVIAGNFYFAWEPSDRGLRHGLDLCY